MPSTVNDLHTDGLNKAPQPLNQDLTLTSPRLCRMTQSHTLHHQQNERKQRKICDNRLP